MDGSEEPAPEALPPAPRPATGLADGLVADRFRLDGLLGTGGSASVFRAVDTTTGAAVAVKILHPHLAESPALREAFLAEARRSEAVRHPHIAPVVAVGVHDDATTPAVWIAQGLAPGLTLSEHIRTNGRLAVRQAADVGIAVLDALTAAHAAGLVHRDISPANVMVALDGDRVARVHLLDFGLADAAGQTARGGDVLRSTASSGRQGVVGNVRFASPEQLRGEPVGGRGDLYQVGGLLYFMLTGSAPYPQESHEEMVRAHISAPPPVPSVRTPGIPPELDRVVVRALLKHPGDRFPDAATMASALAAAVGQGPTRGGPVSAEGSQTSIATVGGDDVTTFATEDPNTGATRVLAPAVGATRSLSATTAAALAPGRAVPAAQPERRGTGVWLFVVLVPVVIAIGLVVGPALVAAPESGPSPSSSPAVSASAPQATPPQAPVPSEAPALVAVPQLGSLADVRSAIEAAGLRVGRVTNADAPLPADTVLSSDPAPGTRVQPGAQVSLTIASGSNAVPDIDGMPGAAALATVRAAGFEPIEVRLSAPDVPEGVAFATRPSIGRSLPLGSDVSVLVAVGAAPTPAPSTSPTPVPTPTATATPPGAP